MPRVTLSRRLRTKGSLPMHASVGFRGETRTAIVYLLENVVEVYVRLRVAPVRCSGARRTVGWFRFVFVAAPAELWR